MDPNKKPPLYFTLITEIRDGGVSWELVRARLFHPDGRVIDLSHKDKAWLNRFGCALVNNCRGRYAAVNFRKFNTTED